MNNEKIIQIPRGNIKPTNNSSNYIIDTGMVSIKRLHDVRGAKMIEITCTEREKEHIINSLMDYFTCLFGCKNCEYESCRMCLNHRIIWNIIYKEK